MSATIREVFTATAKTWVRAYADITTQVHLRIKELEHAVTLPNVGPSIGFSFYPALAEGQWDEPSLTLTLAVTWVATGGLTQR